MVKARLPMVTALVLGAIGLPAAGEPAANCPDLVRIRDTVLAHRVDKTNRLIDLTEEAIRRMDAVVEATRSEDEAVRLAFEIHKGLHLLQMAGDAAQIVLSFIAPQGVTAAAAMRNAGGVEALAWGGVDAVVRQVGNASAVHSIATATEPIDVYLGAGSLLPVLGSYVAFAKSTVEMGRMYREGMKDLQIIADRTRSTRKQLAAARNKLLALRDQGGSYRALKDEIDRRCNMTATKPKPRPVLPAVLKPPPVEAPPRTEALNCRMLDTEAGMELAVDDPHRFEALYKRCNPGYVAATPTSPAPIDPLLCAPIDSEALMEGKKNRNVLRPRDPVTGECPPLPGDRR